MSIYQELNTTSTQHLLALDEFALLDIAAGLKAVGSQAVLRELLTYLIHEALAEDMTLIQAAYADHDWDKIQQLAHKIKGGAMYVGTIRLTMACQYLEQYWETGQQEHLERLYQQILTVIHETIKTVSAWLS